MKKFKLMILISSIVWIVSCVPHKRRRTNVTFNRKTGEVIAVDNLIHEYERKHNEFYKKEIRNGDDYLKWPELDNKDLSIYCRKYLQNSVPSRNTHSATGSKFSSTLHYKKENIDISNDIVIVQCKVWNSQPAVSYYITRASTSNCVYALNCTGSWTKFIFTIINKYCDFEVKRSIIKWKTVEIIKMLHQSSGQPVAKDEYLLEYELEHLQLLIKKGVDGKSIDWPYIMLHENLDFYCYQYMKHILPRRTREGVTGTWKSGKLEYQKVNTHGDVDVITVICQVPINCKRHYYMTRAPEINCVYALLRKNYRSRDPLIIIFKHCSFQDTKDWESGLKDYNNLHKNASPKNEVKDDIFDTMETQQLFLNN